MKILLLGGTGMLGHQLVKHLSKEHEVFAPPRQQLGWHFEPEVVINCAGIVKQRVSTPEEMIFVNSVYPHQLSRVAKANGARLIHFSTDCVFSGKDGDYSELDQPDPVDMYGRSKLLGEPALEDHVVTLRTSIIGPELNGRKHGLLEWFLSQTGEVQGYINAYFTGLTTIEMGRVIDCVLACPHEHGMFHVGGRHISKYHLLRKLKDHYGLPVTVAINTDVHCDRTLLGGNFSETFGYSYPSWDQMIRELPRDDPTARMHG